MQSALIAALILKKPVGNSKLKHTEIAQITAQKALRVLLASR